MIVSPADSHHEPSCAGDEQLSLGDDSLWIVLCDLLVFGGPSHNKHSLIVKWITCWYKWVLLHEQSWLHTAIALCSCTYTVCLYGVYTLAFAPTVIINTQRLPFQIDINHPLLTSSFVQHNTMRPSQDSEVESTLGQGLLDPKMNCVVIQLFPCHREWAENWCPLSVQSWLRIAFVCVMLVAHILWITGTGWTMNEHLVFTRCSRKFFEYSVSL
jgi:hypothetical protein